MFSRATIRKITIGNNPKEGGIAFQVGGKTIDDEYRISSIIEDTNSFFSFGDIRYLVFISNGKKEYLWKSFQRVPVTVEYFLPNEKYINIV